MGEGYPILAIFGDTGLLFAYKQWGTQITNSSNTSLSVALPISVKNILIAVTSNCDNVNAISTAIGCFSSSSLYVHTWRGTDYANDKVAYIVVCI